MATATQSTLSFIFDEVVSEVAYEAYYDLPYLWPVLYSVRNSMGRRERSASLGGLGLFQSKAETADASEGTVTQQFEKTFTHAAFSLKLPISREVVDDNEWGFLQEVGLELGNAAGQTMESRAAALFDDAFAGATYLAEDGLSVCHNAHVNVDGSNSQDNLLTNALSMSGIKSARTAMRKWTNYGGQKIAVNPDELLVRVDQEEDAWEIVRSVSRPDNANNAANMYNGMFNLYVWPFLSTSDTNDWFMMDSRLRARNLIWYQRIGLEIFGDGNLSAGTKTIGGYFRHSHGVKDWRFILGNRVT